MQRKNEIKRKGGIRHGLVKFNEERKEEKEKLKVWCKLSGKKRKGDKKEEDEIKCELWKRKTGRRLEKK